MNVDLKNIEFWVSHGLKGKQLRFIIYILTIFGWMLFLLTQKASEFVGREINLVCYVIVNKLARLRNFAYVIRICIHLVCYWVGVYMSKSIELLTFAWLFLSNLLLLLKCPSKHMNDTWCTIFNFYAENQYCKPY